MKSFNEWLKDKVVLEDGFSPNMGQQAQMPQQNQQGPPQQLQQPQQNQQNQQPQQNQQQPQQISLSTFANKISDASWHQLYNNFAKQYQNNPNDPQVSQLGQALYQAAQSGNMSGLQPFKNQIQGQGF